VWNDDNTDLMSCQFIKRNLSTPYWPIHATKLYEFSKLADLVAIVGLKKTIIGKANTWFLVSLAQLLRYRCHDSTRHTTVGHN